MEGDVGRPPVGVGVRRNFEGVAAAEGWPGSLQIKRRLRGLGLGERIGCGDRLDRARHRAQEAGNDGWRSGQAGHIGGISVKRETG